MTLIAITKGFYDPGEALRFAHNQRKYTPDVMVLYSIEKNGTDRTRKCYTVVRPATRETDRLLVEWMVEGCNDDLIRVNQ
jgi:hypothetical protein